MAGTISKRDQLEIAKLQVELEGLRRPVWMKSSFWLSIAPILVAIGTLAIGFTTGFFSTQEKLLEIRKEKLTTENNELIRQRDSATRERDAALKGRADAAHALKGVRDQVEQAERELGSLRAELARLRRAEECAPVRIHLDWLRFRMSRYGSLPSLVNLSTINVLAKSKLRLSDRHSTQLAAASGNWHLEYPPGSPYLAGLEHRDMASRADSTNRARLMLSPDPDRKPVVVTGTSLLDDAMMAPGTTITSRKLFEQFIASAATNFRDTLSADLNFELPNDFLPFYDMKDGILSAIEPYPLEHLRANMVSHYEAHQAMAAFFKNLSAAAEAHCPNLRMN